MRRTIAFCLCGLSIAASAQSKYSNAKYGISFHYPAGYVLKEGALDDNDPGMGYLGPTPIEFVADGGVRIVTIELPDAPYLGTDFTSAFFTASIHPNMTSAECERFSDNPLLDMLHTEKYLRKKSAALCFTELRSALVV